MIHIDGTTIEMTRGDTLIAEVSIMQGDEPYIPQTGDKMRFALKSPKMNLRQTEYVDPQPLIEVDIPIDTLLLRLEPENTKPLGFGSYVYDIQLTFADGRVDTFITSATLKLLPEVD